MGQISRFCARLLFFKRTIAGVFFSSKNKKRAERRDLIALKGQNPAGARSFARPASGRSAKKDKF
jgi:hypothetical protein